MGGGGKDYDIPETEEPDPVAPASPASRGSAETAQAAAEEQAKAKKAYSRDKTVLTRGAMTGVADKTKLGG